MHRRRLPLAALFLLLTAAVMTLAIAPSFACGDDYKCRDAMRKAVKAGQILPLSEILNRVRSKVSGDIMGVDIRHEHDLWRYELRVIDRDGRMLDVTVDAHNGRVERIEEE